MKYCFLILSLSVFAACSDDEEILTPSTDVDDIKFAVPADASGPEAELRRKFYKDNGSYLMFSDLLQRTYMGTDAAGNDIYKNEYIDFGYKSFLNSSYNDNLPKFEFLDEDFNTRKDGVALIDKYIMPHVAGTKLIPFSILVTESIIAFDDDWNVYDWVDAKDVSCWRCMAIAVGEWLSLPENERSEYANDILIDIVKLKFTYETEEAKPFVDQSKEYANNYIVDILDDWDRDIERVYELGFLTYFKGWRGESGDYLPKYNEDLNMYIAEVISHDKDDFEAIYGNYPLIMKKYNMVMEALIAIGYKF